jgi:hypothetical protein
VAEEVVPQAVQTLLQILVGNDWPEGNPSDLRSLAGAWRDAGAGLRALESETLAAVRHVDGAILGQTRVAFDAYAARLTGDGDGYLPTLAAICDSLGDALDTMAREIETLRTEIIGLLVTLAVQLMIDAAFALFGTESAAAVQVAAARVAARILIRKAVVRLSTQLAESELAQVGWDLFAQLVNGHGGSINTRELRDAAIGGAVGGAVGLGVGGLGSVLAGGAKRVLGNRFPTTLSDAASSGGTANDVSGFAAHVGDVGWNAAAGAAEAAAQDAALGSSGDTVSGAENGGFAGLQRGAHSVLNHGNRYSLSPADHLNLVLDRVVDRPPDRPEDQSLEPEATTPPDGTSVTVHPDGTRVTLSPDGSRLTSWPDGTRRVTTPDGAELITFRDGATLVSLPDGTTMTTHADGTEVVVSADGTRVGGPGGQPPSDVGLSLPILIENTALSAPKIAMHSQDDR